MARFIFPRWQGSPWEWLKKEGLKDMIKKLEVGCYFFAVVAVIATIIF